MDITKICSKCQQEKPLLEFGPDRRNYDGRQSRCRACYREWHRDYSNREAVREKRKTSNQRPAARQQQKRWRNKPVARAKNTWAWILKRAGKVAGYRHVEVRMTRDEFLAWAVPRYTQWMQQHPNETPSIDRIESAGHYQIDNLQIAARGENAARTKHNKQLTAPTGTSWCSTCCDYLPIDQFTADSSRPNGLERRCRVCNKNRQRQQRAQSPITTRDCHSS
jgi:hypothetical protein